MGQYQHRTYRTITMVRGGLISIVYRKTGALCLKDIDPATSMTVMSADIERIVQGWQSMHEIWASFIEVGIAIFLLEQQLGVACVVPVVVSLCKSAIPDCLYLDHKQISKPAPSVTSGIHDCHELHNVPPSTVARGYRETHLSHLGHAGVYERHQDVWP